MTKRKNNFSAGMGVDSRNADSRANPVPAFYLFREAKK